MRLLRVARAAYGTALLAAPIRMVRALGGDPKDDVAVFAARALGARHVLQALATGSHPGALRRAGGAVVDALHAASMFAVAATDPSRRRPASIDGSVAAALFVAGWAAGPAG